MSNTFKVIYSTLAVVMVVNSFVFALPIVANAQAIEKQQIEQIQLTATQKAEFEKAQKEAKLAMYKELGLSTAEKKFVEKYSAKMELFSQAIDKYVSYNKKNGNATVDVTAIYKNMKAIRTATGLTQNEVLTVKDIALKMVRKYNKTVNSIASGVTSSQKAASSNVVASVKDASDIKVTKGITERGFEITFATDVIDSSKSAEVKAGFVFDVPFLCRGASLTIKTEWWGIWGVMNDCMVSGFKIAFNVIFGTIVAKAAQILGGPLGIAFGVAFTFLSNTYAATIDRTNRECGYRGVGYAGTWANFYAPWIRRIC